VATEISFLNKVSNTIRRASNEVQILKASSFQIKDDEGNDMEPLLLTHFEHYIGGRFPNINNTIQRDSLTQCSSDANAFCKGDIAKETRRHSCRTLPLRQPLCCREKRRVWIFERARRQVFHQRR